MQRYLNTHTWQSLKISCSTIIPLYFSAVMLFPLCFLKKKSFSYTYHERGRVFKTSDYVLSFRLTASHKCHKQLCQHQQQDRAGSCCCREIYSSCFSWGKEFTPFLLHVVVCVISQVDHCAAGGEEVCFNSDMPCAAMWNWVYSVLPWENIQETNTS